MELPQTSLHSSSHGDRTQANIELTELGRTESIKSNELSTGPSISPPERTKSELWTARIQFASLCWTLFLSGWNDGTTGPLLPRIQEVYHVTLLTDFSTFLELTVLPRPISLSSLSFSSLARS